ADSRRAEKSSRYASRGLVSCCGNATDTAAGCRPGEMSLRTVDVPPRTLTRAAAHLLLIMGRAASGLSHVDCLLDFAELDSRAGGRDAPFAPEPPLMPTLLPPDDLAAPQILPRRAAPNGSHARALKSDSAGSALILGPVRRITTCEDSRMIRDGTNAMPIGQRA